MEQTSSKHSPIEAELTAKQIKDLDVITGDEKAVNQTLQIALNFHANSIYEINKKLRKWWDDTLEAHKLPSRKEKKYRIDKGVIVTIKECDSDGAK